MIDGLDEGTFQKQKAELEKRQAEAADEKWAYEHPIPDETDRQRAERQELFYKADRKYQLVSGELSALRYEWEQEKARAAEEKRKERHAETERRLAEARRKQQEQSQAREKEREDEQEWGR